MNNKWNLGRFWRNSAIGWDEDDPTWGADKLHPVGYENFKLSTLCLVDKEFY